VTPAEAIDAANAVFGVHPGFRALHAKGVRVAGRFVATPAAAALSSAAHLSGAEVPVVVRFSGGAGNPEHPDFLPEPKGMAVKFTLPDGATTDIVAVTTSVFPVATPEGFIALLRAQAKPHRLAALLARNPRVAVALAKAAPSLRPIASFAAARYHALHAFRLTDAAGGSRFVRYRLLPGDLEQHLSPMAARRLGPDYLIPRLVARLAEGPVTFTLEAQIAGEGATVDDPSRTWPADWERVALGTLTLTGLDESRERDGDVLVFDPTRVVPGIELSDDPVLHFRSPAYRESVARRT
jgi:catalase